MKDVKILFISGSYSKLFTGVIMDENKSGYSIGGSSVKNGYLVKIEAFVKDASLEQDSEKTKHYKGVACIVDASSIIKFI